MKKLNIQLVHSIIKSDFFISENKKLKNFVSVFNKDFNVLDIIKLHFSVKQLIRILQFIKKKGLPINILNSNQQYKKIFQLFFRKNKKNITFLDTFHSFDCLHIFINNLNKSKKSLLTFEINSNSNSFNKSNYKIFNNLDSFKKVVFLMAVIENIYNKKN